jgi:hypothetical protein
VITTACSEYRDDAAGNNNRLLIDKQEYFPYATAFGAPMKKATFVAMDGLKSVC